MELIDSFNRKHDYLRISLTDRCNYKCIYCNPEKHVSYSSLKNNLLSFDEIERLIEIFVSELNFKKIRFTGGEPLLRKDVFNLFNRAGKLKEKYGFKLGLTTNGSLIEGRLSELKKIGFDSINISLDSLNENKFKFITGRNDLLKLLNVIAQAQQVGFNPVKLNVVVLKGINDNEILDFVERFKWQNINLRFIEFMPFSFNRWAKNGFISFKEMKAIVETKYDILPLNSSVNSVAKNFKLINGRCLVSFISSITEHFCDTCNRVRLKAEGTFKVCLFSSGKDEINFKKLFKNGKSDEEIVEILKRAILKKWEKHPAANVLSNEITNNMMEIGG